MNPVRRYPGVVALAAAIMLALPVGAPQIRAQTVIVEGPTSSTLPTVTPTFTLKALGVPLASRPLLFTLYISRSPNVDNAFIETIAVPVTDTIVTVRVTRALPHNTNVYWRARVTSLPDGRTIDSEITGPRLSPSWLTLVSPFGGPINERRPRFTWASAPIDPAVGRWLYDLQVSDKSGTKVTTAGLSETFFDTPSNLEANTIYSWRVVARIVPGGDSLVVASASPFIIIDPSLPTTTLLYQNFPNPFPSATSPTTCFWFDVGAGGAQISLDIVDLRGTLVKRIVPASRFDAGKYGPGAINSGNSCDKRYLWDGTSTDGRVVPPGVYLIKFIASGKVTFKKLLFRGR